MGYERNDRRGFGDPRGFDRDNDRNSDFQGNYGNRDPRSERFGDRDRGYERSSGYGNDRGGFSYGSDRARDYGRAPQGYDYQDRGFFDRAGDEVRSWFGDDEAERRRRFDERYAQQESGRNAPYAEGGRYSPYGAGHSNSAGGSFGRGDAGSGYGPGDYGAAQGFGRDREGGRDPGYHSWRDRQIQALDQDYDDYRREHQSKFDSEFGTWRQTRQGQRDLAGKVQEHSEVIGSDGKHVGTVDHIRGHDLLLTKTDQDAGGHHHTVPSSWIQAVDSTKVTLNKTADQAKAQWRDAEQNQGGGGMFSRDGRESDRGHAGDTKDAGSRAFSRS